MIDAKKARSKAKNRQKILSSVWAYIDFEASNGNFSCIVDSDYITNEIEKTLKEHEFGYKHILGTGKVKICWMHNNRKDNMSALGIY